MSKIVIWDGQQPINGIKAETVLRNREDLANALGDIFLVMTGDVVTEIQIGKTISANYNLDPSLSLEEIANAYLAKKAEEEETEKIERLTNEELQEEIAVLSYEVMLLQAQQGVKMFTSPEGEHSPKYNLIRKWYNRGFWTSDMVQDAVEMGKLTQEECNEILNK